jgi:hypothetical protein
VNPAARLLLAKLVNRLNHLGSEYKHSLLSAQSPVLLAKLVNRLNHLGSEYKHSLLSAQSPVRRGQMTPSEEVGIVLNSESQRVPVADR